MINKNKDLWQVDLKQIQRIKSGIQKYVGGIQIPRNRDKILHTPSQPLSPNRIPHSKQAKKSSRNSQNNLQPLSPLRLQKQLTKDKINISGKTQPMPNGYWRNKAGKIMRAQQTQKQQIQQLSNMLRLQKKQLNSTMRTKKNQAKKLQQSQSPRSNDVIQSPKIVLTQPIQNKNKFEELQKVNQQLEQINLTIQENVLPQKIIISSKNNNQPPVRKQKPYIEQASIQNIQSSQFMSVSKIAQLFGGKKKNVQQSINLNKKQKGDQKIANDLKRNTSIMEKQTIKENKNQQDEKSSQASFGKNDKKMLFRKATISQFLGLKGENAQRQKEREKTRKRSHTFQQDSSEYQRFRTERSNQKYSSKFQNKRQGKKDQSQKNFSIKVQHSLKSHKRQQFKQNAQYRITFSGSQQQELKNKYNALSLKLDNLREKVISQNKNSIGYERDIKSKEYKKIQAIMLYNKYSPLKILQKMRQQKKRQYDKEILSNQKRKQDKYTSKKKDKSFVF